MKGLSINMQKKNEANIHHLGWSVKDLLYGYHAGTTTNLQDNCG